MEQQLNSGNQGTGTAPPPPPPPAQPEYKPVKNESDLAFRISRDSRVRVIFTGEVTQEAIEKLRILLEHSKDTFPTKAEIEKPRTGIWRSKDLDMSVTVTGSAGVGTDGRRYVNIEGSDTAIPEDEIEYDSQ